MNDWIYNEVLRTYRRYKTRDPFEILDAMGVNVVFTQDFRANGLKGYCACFNRITYVVINGKLCEEEQRVVAAHELGHLILHQDELKMGAFKDNDVYNPTSQWEREANCYAADLLCSDEEVLEFMQIGDTNFFQVAQSLCIPAPFFAFKLFSMVDRGLPVRMPVELDSTFLAK